MVAIALHIFLKNKGITLAALCYPPIVTKTLTERRNESVSKQQKSYINHEDIPGLVHCCKKFVLIVLKGQRERGRGMNKHDACWVFWKWGMVGRHQEESMS